MRRSFKLLSLAAVATAGFSTATLAHVGDHSHMSFTEGLLHPFSGLDPQRGSGGNLIGFAKFNSGRHCGGFSCEVDGSRIDVGFRPWVSAGGQLPPPWLEA